MPTAITIRLEATEPLFFDETWPLEGIFLDVLKRSQPEIEKELETKRPGSNLKPYTVSPVRRAQGKRPPAPSTNMEGKLATTYQWRVSLLDEALTPHLLRGLEATEALTLNGNPLTISGVTIEECAYQDIARQAQEQAGASPDEERRIGLEFVTPAVLYRSGLPMPLPDPPLVFEYYLRAWDTFAPRELWVNFNLLDAVAFHVAVTEHHLETRRVRLAGGETRVGCLGSVTYTVMSWQKLGVEFLGQLHMLARFSDFCGTGELTANGMGQTRYAA